MGLLSPSLSFSLKNKNICLHKFSELIFGEGC